MKNSKTNLASVCRLIVSVLTEERFFIHHILLITICISSCKSTYTAINDQKAGVKVMLPKNTVPIQLESLENKYSGELYKANRPRVWYQVYQIDKDVVLLFNYRGSANIPENIDKEKKTFKLGMESSLEVVNLKFKEELINSNLFWFVNYEIKNNKEDHFVNFLGDMRKPNRIWGRIRFPAGYSQEEIEKQTVKILSGIKFTK